jgi:multidrug resistance efflux pump
MRFTLTPGVPSEALRGQPLRRLRRTHIGDDGRRLARDYHASPHRRSLRFSTICLAPGAICICRLLDPTVINRTLQRALEPTMSDGEIQANREASTVGRTLPSAPFPPRQPAENGCVARRPITTGLRRPAVSLLITLASVALAIVLGQAMWRAYVEAPWTRDGTVRAYVVTMAPEISGRIAELRVTDNQFVHKGDVLMVIDPTDYKIAVIRSEAALQEAQSDADNIAREAQRRARLNKVDAVALEQAQTYESKAEIAQAQVRQAIANLRQARVNLERTRIRAPVNGWVTNLLAQRADFANIGQSEISLVDADSFWVDAYFEETQLRSIRDGDAAIIQLMGYRQVVRGHVTGISRGINIPNAQPNQQGLATVNPIFTWVRLAQRIPVHVHIDSVPQDVRLVAGITAAVGIVTPSIPPTRSTGHEDTGR